MLTRDKPQMRSIFSFAFVNNAIAGVLCYPLFYLAEGRNWMKGLRGSLLVLCFSLANDVFIEFKRKGYMSQNFTEDELK